MSDYHVRTVLWQLACCGHGFSLALADEGQPWSLGARGQGASGSWDSVIVTARWRFPAVTLLVTTTFSPCPLAQEWKHRILRSPHARGQVGTYADAPF